MPYIKKEDREKYDVALNQIQEIHTKGDLEYCIFKLMQTYMSTRSVRYSNLHDTVYASVHCGDEFRRRYLDVREDVAREDNGDVF
jgi:hypothetical protein